MAETEKAPETPKRPRKVGVTYDLSTKALTAFALESDGSTKHGELSFNLADFPAEVQTQFALHGVVQKFTDEARNGDTPADRFKMLQDRLDSLMAGKWGERLADSSVDRLIQALKVWAQEEGKSLDEAAWRERLTKKPAMRLQVMAQPKVNAVYNRLYPTTGDDEALGELS